MWGSIKYNLSHLLDFSGRDARQTFWFYVLFLFIVNMVVGIAIAVPFIGQMFSNMSAAIESGDPQAIQTSMAADMGEMIETSVWAGLFTGIANMALIAAAVVRRLHDSSLPGWWAALPAALQAGSIYLTFSQLDKLKGMVTEMMAAQVQGDPQAAFAMQSQMQGQSLLGWLPLIALVVIGVRKSTPGPNQYAEAPVSF
jgi:uncharacterized membrane protein YhaH (DUF805 family)